MKKFLSLVCLFSVFFCLNAQQTTANAGLTVPQDRIRTGEEGFAAEEFRRGVQAFYKGSFSDAIVQFEKALSYLPNDNLNQHGSMSSRHRTVLITLLLSKEHFVSN